MTNRKPPKKVGLTAAKEPTMNTTQTVKARREAATKAALQRMHKFWHLARNIDCTNLKCDHPWAP